MHAKTTVAALLLAAFAGSALADDPTIVNEQFAGSRTRAEVNAELAAYRAAGVNPWANSYQPLKYFRSATSREAVVADYTDWMQSPGAAVTVHEGCVIGRRPGAGHP